MKALIAAGGRATRLRPITYTLNKHLIPLANKPMIFHVIEKIVDAGIREIFVNVNPGEDELQKYVGDGSRWGVQIRYIEQAGGPKGLAHIVLNAETHLQGEPFLFYLGDNILLGSLRELVEKFTRETLDMCLAFSQVRDPERFGVPEFDSQGKLIRIVEKPAHPSCDLAQTGIYIYSPKIFEAVKAIAPSARGEYEISDANTYLIEHGGRVSYIVTQGWWKDTGKPEDLLEGNQLILNTMTWEETENGAEVADDVMVQGRVKIGKGTVISDRALIRGPVVIGENCVIRNSYIGPYTSIGKGVEIYNTEIEHSIVMDDADINCGTRIVDSIIGYNATVISAHDTLPLGHKLVVGDHAVVEI